MSKNNETPFEVKVRLKALIWGSKGSLKVVSGLKSYFQVQIVCFFLTKSK